MDNRVYRLQFVIIILDTYFPTNKIT